MALSFKEFTELSPEDLQIVEKLEKEIDVWLAKEDDGRSGFIGIFYVKNDVKHKYSIVTERLRRYRHIAWKVTFKIHPYDDYSAEFAFRKPSAKFN